MFLLKNNIIQTYNENAECSFPFFKEIYWLKKWNTFYLFISSI